MLCGNVLGPIGTLPEVYHDIDIQFTKINDIWEPKNGDQIFLQIENMTSEARLTKTKGEKFSIQLIKPTCISKDSKILICRKQPMITIVGVGELI